MIRSAIWSDRALSLGKKVTTSDNFRAGFKTLSFSQRVYSLFAADKGTNPETAGRPAIENIYQLTLIVTIEGRKLSAFNQIKNSINPFNF